MTQIPLVLFTEAEVLTGTAVGARMSSGLTDRTMPSSLTSIVTMCLCSSRDSISVLLDGFTRAFEASGATLLVLQHERIRGTPARNF